jgi:hypothetical protein
VWTARFDTVTPTYLYSCFVYYCTTVAAVLVVAIHNSDPEEDICAVAGQTNRDLLRLVRETARAFELSPLLQTLAVELRSHHVPTRLAALRWLDMLLERAPREMGCVTCVSILLVIVLSM